MSDKRCTISGNPCGTDTWRLGEPPNCECGNNYRDHESLAGSHQMGEPPEIVDGKMKGYPMKHKYTAENIDMDKWRKLVDMESECESVECGAIEFDNLIDSRTKEKLVIDTRTGRPPMNKHERWYWELSGVINDLERGVNDEVCLSTLKRIIVEIDAVNREIKP